MLTPFNGFDIGKGFPFAISDLTHAFARLPESFRYVLKDLLGTVSLLSTSFCALGAFAAPEG